MSDRQTLLDLARRCEEASEGSDALDGEIACAVLGWRPVTGQFARFYIAPDGTDCDEPPHYTASLDAAMMLVPAKAVETHIAFGKWGNDASILMPTKEHQAKAATPALALTAAALKAIAAMADAPVAPTQQDG